MFWVSFEVVVVVWFGFCVLFCFSSLCLVGFVLGGVFFLLLWVCFLVVVCFVFLFILSFVFYLILVLVFG